MTAGTGDSRDRHDDVASRILEVAIRDGGAARYAQHLSDRIGPRLAGSPGEKAAVAWAVAEIRRLGLAPREEPIPVPVWIRGDESARLLAPADQALVVTALGGSVPTPAGGIRAGVVEVESVESLRAIGRSEVEGRIVLWNAAMGPGLEGYGAVVNLRTDGASEAGRLGAVASLVRSIGTSAHRLAHTGCVCYADDAPKIPAAAICAEDAALLHRLLAAGDSANLLLHLHCVSRPDEQGANVVVELPGRERPDEIVLIGAHLDAWDLGTGAVDDAAGVGIVLDTLRMLKELGMIPRRTIRAVLYANEENGLRGGEGYARSHAAELDGHVVAIEADAGAGRPEGLAVHAGPGGIERVRTLCGRVLPEGSRLVERIDGADISPLAAYGVPLLALLQDQERYFDWHHTAADTFDKIDPRSLAESSAFMAGVSYAFAETAAVLPRPNQGGPP